MTFSLSQDDVARLMTGPSPELRIDLARKLGHDMQESPLNQEELRIAEDIVRILARDVEVLVRSVLSANIRANPKIPRDVALLLASDVESVALPILADSVSLADSDLIAIVRDGSPAKQVAVARRNGVSEAVSDALVTYGDEIAVSTLLQNRSAQVAEPGLQKAVDRFGDSETVTASMVNRDRLPIAVAERLAVMVSEHLRQHLVRRHSLSPALASDIILEGRESAILTLGRGASAPDLQQLVAQMHQNGRLTPSLVLNAVCMGDIAFFEAAMAQLALVPIENARTLIHDPGGQGLSALYRKAEMPAVLYPAFKAALETIAVSPFDGAPRELERFRSRIIARVLTQVEAIDTQDVDYLVGKLTIMAQRSDVAA